MHQNTCSTHRWHCLNDQTHKVKQLGVVVHEQLNDASLAGWPRTVQTYCFLCMQVYEETAGLTVGDVVTRTKKVALSYVEYL